VNVSQRAGAVREHEHEPVHGLPEELPGDERVLWQGAPDWRAMAVRAFHVRKLIVYFALMLALRGSVVLHDGGSALDAVRAVATLAPLALLGIGLTLLLAWLSARSTAYTLTNRRVVMRIGIVLTLSFNLPLKRIAAAELAPAPRDTGDIALELAGNDRIAWLQLWPHARPWRVAKPQPMLRCVPQGAQVAQLLAQTWSQATGLDVQPIDAADAPLSPLPAQDSGRGVQGTALATR
jgi:Bacterial PH domain